MKSSHVTLRSSRSNNKCFEAHPKSAFGLKSARNPGNHPPISRNVVLSLTKLTVYESRRPPITGVALRWRFKVEQARLQSDIPTDPLPRWSNAQFHNFPRLSLILSPSCRIPRHSFQPIPSRLAGNCDRDLRRSRNRHASCAANDREPVGEDGGRGSENRGSRTQNSRYSRTAGRERTS